MKLPHAKNAYVPKEKLTEYLLSTSHMAGGSKARFFLKYGFKGELWSIMSAALVSHADSNEVARVEQTIFGFKYIINGEIETPSGENPLIQSVWFIGTNESIPRFVTAYPMAGRDWL